MKELKRWKWSPWRMQATCKTQGGRVTSVESWLANSKKKLYFRVHKFQRWESLEGNLPYKIQVKSIDPTSGSMESTLFEDDASNCENVTTSGTYSVYDFKALLSQIQVREYRLVPGSSPSATSGPPLECGWAHIDRVSHTWTDGKVWEMGRQGCRPKEEYHLMRENHYSWSMEIHKSHSEMQCCSCRETAEKSEYWEVV